MRTVKRGKGLAANPAKTRAWQQRSREAQRLDDTDRAVREAVFARDGHRCQLRDYVGQVVPPDHDGPGARWVEVPRCWGQLTFHHRRKAGAQGAYAEANGATLCYGHNGWVEDEPDAAQAVLPHLVVRDGDPDWDALGKRANR